MRNLKETLIQEFKDYVNQFDFSENAIKRKYYHSFRVMDHSMLLAKRVGLNDNDSEIAAIIGLFHDIARFRQWTEYHTYEDIHSIDHGDLGVKILFDEKLIEDFYKLEDNYDEIYDAIKYHNKKELPSNLSNHNRLLCNVVRDADKLDILYLFTINEDIIIESNDEITEEVKEDFFNERLVDSRNIKNSNDKIIRTLAFVYDINFDMSFKYLIDYKIFNNLFDSLEHKEMFKPYFDEVYKYIEKRIDKNA